jgi:divalent metal cation (Fe/Co/Zn/Cd) transporter
MSYRQIEQTIQISEQKSDRLPVNVDGEITVTDTTIAVEDVDAKAEEIHELTSELEEAIEDVFEAHEVSDDA